LGLKGFLFSVVFFV